MTETPIDLERFKRQANSLIRDSGAWTAVPLNPSTLLALIEVAEAAQADCRAVAKPPRGMFPTDDRLRDALTKFKEPT